MPRDDMFEIAAWRTGAVDRLVTPLPADSQVVDSGFPTDPAAARSDALRMPDVRAPNTLNPVSFAGTPIHAPMLARNLLMQV